MAVILTLGLALGANATMFGIVDRLLLRAPPHIHQPEGVVRVLVSRFFGGGDRPPGQSISYVAFTDLRDRAGGFAAVAAAAHRELSLGLGRDARPLKVTFATGEYWRLLGTDATLGRVFGPEEDQLPSGQNVVVVGFDFWQRHHGGRGDILGQQLLLNSRQFTVVGVAPKGFNGINLQPVDIWVPFSAGMTALDGSWEVASTQRGSQFLYTIARLRDGVAVEGAEAEAERAYQLGHTEADWGRYEREARITLAPLIQARGPTAPVEAKISGWLLGVTVIVLLIACANVANLLLARGIQRRPEIAVRLTLGVSRMRLFRQLTAETMLLAGLGALAGLALVIVGGGVIRSALLPGVFWDESPVNTRVMLLTLVATIFATFAAGLLPMLRAGQLDLASALRGSARGSTATGRMRPALLLVQTSLTTLLLVGAGLFVRSLNQIRQVDLGLDIDRTLVVALNQGTFGRVVGESGAFYTQLMDRLRTEPGVEAVGLSVGGPFLSNWAASVRVPGRDTLPSLPGGGPYYFAVSPGAAEALGVRLLQGRLFTAQDRAGSPPVTIVTERMAQALWPDQSPLGRCFHHGDEEAPCSEVVGVVADIHRQGIQEDPFLLYLMPLEQAAGGRNPDYLFVRTAGSSALMVESVRRQIQALAPDLPYVSVRPMMEEVSPEMRPWQLGATMFAIFGLLALVTAAVGLYGVLSFAVTQRSREFGIRTALGARPATILGGVVRNGMMMAGLGIVLGLGVALLLGRWVGPLLFETSPNHAGTIAGVAVTVMLISAGASYLPARRAVRVNPIEVMRAE
jgi:predicted permease